MIALKSEVESLAEKGSDAVSDVADEVLQAFAAIATPLRCAMCGVHYIAGLPEGNLPYICAKCGNRALYPEDRFTIVKLYCNDCGNVFIAENIPGRGSQFVCHKCGRGGACQMYKCQSCGNTWGGHGFVTSCPKCGASQVGSVSVTREEAAQFRSRR